MASIENLKILKYHTFSFILSIICSKYGNEDEKIFKEELSIETLKTLDLCKNI